MKSKSGFTIVELLIVIVVISILATIAIVVFNGIQDRARLSKMQTDIKSIKQAMMLARESQQKPIEVITGNRGYGSGGTGAACNALAAGTDLKALSQSSACWVSYNNFLDKVSDASGMNIRGTVDPWGWPYSVSEAEYPGECFYNDEIWAFAKPYSAWGGRIPGTYISLSASGYCS